MMTNKELLARRASAKYLNSVSFSIQDHASDEGWIAAQIKIAEADVAHNNGEYDLARTLIDQAHAIAFPA
jgi:hypothetical protein